MDDLCLENDVSVVAMTSIVSTSTTLHLHLQLQLQTLHVMVCPFCHIFVSKQSSKLYACVSLRVVGCWRSGV
jgi:hypothetical protein